METTIETILRENFLAAVPAASGKTRFENVAFSAEGLTKYYIFTFLPSPPIPDTLGVGGRDIFSGLVQIDYNAKDGYGLDGLGDFLTALRSRFTTGAVLTKSGVSVQIRSCGRTGASRRVEGFHRFTVTISWESRINRNT